MKWNYLKVIKIKPGFAEDISRLFISFLALLLLALQLRWILNDGRYDHILEWQKDGRSFTVKNKVAMEQILLKALSGKVQKYKSFTKKVCETYL